jgi:hypothetical protein
LSSTTDPRSERGQILIIFAFSLLVIFGIAALVFDGGLMLLEKRTQQNAGDAAALAGARFLPAGPGEAEAAARAVATANGFTDGVDSQTVTVNIPPTSGPNAGNGGYIEVLIDNERASFFSGIWGIFSHEIGSRAVAANTTQSLGPFAMLTLDPHGCQALIVEGQGELTSNGNIQVNSDCPADAMRLAGQGEIVTAPDVACNVVGGFSKGGASTIDCPVTAGSGVVPIPDPFISLAEPPIPTDGAGVIVYPIPPVQVAGATKSIPNGCPGGSAPATDAAPALCQFAGSYKDTSWRFYPGYYPGGITFEAGTFYLEPGIYYMGGGGFQLRGGFAALYSVDAGTTTTGGGVLIFNGNHATATSGEISLGGGGSRLQLLPLDAPGSPLDRIVIFQDREVCLDANIVGAASDMFVRGIIYVPGGDSCPADHPVLIAEGNGGTVTVDQVIAFRFQLKGNSGGLNVAYDDNFTQGARVAGLVE